MASQVLYFASFAISIITIVFTMVFLFRRKRAEPVTSLRLGYVVALLLFGFFLAFAAVTSVRIYNVGTSMFFIEQVTPYPYWLGLFFVAVGATYLLIFHNKKNTVILSVIALMLLTVSMRIVFPGLFVSPPSYEPDTHYYMNVVDSWTKTGINLGVPGNYQHDYPMAFIVAYVFVKFGIPIEEFFRWAPSFLYALDILLMYFLYQNLFSQSKEKESIFQAILLFSLSALSLHYFMAVHWCPDLLGASFFLLALGMSIRFAKSGEWKAKTVVPVMLSILLLILTHHLSILYLIVSLFGLAIVTKLYKVPELRGGSLSFFIPAIFTYTIWFAYGSYLYPNFFNLYIYLSGPAGSPVIQLSNQGLTDKLTLLVQPLFVGILFVWGLLRSYEIKLSNLFSVLQKLAKGNISLVNEDRLPVAFAGGFSLIFLLILVGVVVPPIFPDRVLEVFLVGLYPVAGLAISRFCGSSKERKMLLLIVLILLVFVITFRYNRGQQMRLLGP
jgi:hypothetical protein